MDVTTADSLLHTFATAPNAAEADRVLTELVTVYAAPIAKRIVRRKTRGDTAGTSDAEDINSEVMLQLVGRLRRLRDAGAGGRAIESFESYVAVATYNACDRYLSRKRPNRRRLKNGLRYLLTHRPGFNCWQDKHQNWVGGLARWQFAGSDGQTPSGAAFDARLTDLRDDARAFARGRQTPAAWNNQKQAYELLIAVFEWTNQPVDLDLLTNVCAEWWNVTDEIVELDGDYALNAVEKPVAAQLADSRQSIAAENEERVHLQKLWHEILELPARQRAAVLLNLRDEQNRGIIDLWLVVGVTTAQKIAAALEMTQPDFAELWNQLPLDDNQIAARLGLTRQQIINLRKSARERLARRMRGF